MGTTTFLRSTPPTSPVISVGSPTNTSLKITLVTPSSEPVRGVSGYDIERSTNNFLTWIVVASNVSANSFPYTDADALSPGTEYYYRLRGVDNHTPAYRSQESNVATGTTTGSLPSITT